MKALMKKEFDEILKWTVLGLVIMAGALAFVIYTAIKHHPAPSYLISSDEFNFVTTAFCPAIALFLGLFQTWPERKNDLWPFLIHRPLSYTQIFLAKSTVGLSLYFAAVTIPFLLAATWLSIPGNISTPFYWVETLPGFADILAGTGYYFTGLVIGLRSAKWYASKILPLGLPVFGSFAAYLPWFSLAVPCVLAIVTLTAFMAHGCFKTAGTYDRQPVISKTSLAIAITIGISFVGLFTIGIASEIQPLSEKPIYQHYMVDQDGHVITYQQQHYPAIYDFKDLDNPDNPKYDNPPTGEGALDQFRLHMKSASVSGYTHSKFYHMPYNEYWQNLSGYTRDHPQINGRTVYPYYSHIERLILIYDAKSKQLLYYVGPDGFSDPKTKPEKRFSGRPLRTPTLLDIAFKNVIYRLNFADIKLETFFTPDPGDHILDINTRCKYEDYRKSSYQVISTEKTLRLYSSPLTKTGMVDTNPELQVILPAPYDTRKHDWVQIAKMQNGNYMVQLEPSRTFYGKKNQDMPRTMKELTPDGQVIRTFDLPRIKRISPLPKSNFVAFGLFAPAGIAIPGGVIIDHWEQDNLFGPRSIIMFTLMAVSIIICSLTAFIFSKRYAFTKSATTAWIFFIILFGPAALFTFFVIRVWPARPPCPACNKPRIVTHDLCEHCSAPFTKPQPDGTEIIIA